MHFEWLRISGLRGISNRDFDFANGRETLRRWNLFPAGPAASTLLRVLAMAGLGRRQIDMLDPAKLSGWPVRTASPASIEILQIRHAPQERGPTSPARRLLGWTIDARGECHSLRKASLRGQRAAMRCASAESGKSHVGHLVLGYGDDLCFDRLTDCFDILPNQRLRRCAGVLGGEALLTDPVALLRRLRYKAKFRAGRARALLATIEADVQAWLDDSGTSRPYARTSLEACLQTAPFADRAPLTVIIDIARHAFDALPRLGAREPLSQPGVVLLDRPERWCVTSRLPRLFEVLDARFPQLQFFVALGRAAHRCLPGQLLDQRLAIPKPQPRRRPTPPRPLRRGTILLVDVDGTLPNLALMKLSRHYKSCGRRVALAQGVKSLPRADVALASCVFSNAASAARVEVLRKLYGDGLEIGGSGVDLRRRLAPEVEQLPADYSLYPELGDRAIGFLTRGCPQHCPFCAVPIKEGLPRQVGDLETLLQGRRKLILLDDNLLAHPAALSLLEDMVRRDLAVNFNQTLDLRRLTLEAAQLLRRIRCSNVIFTRACYHFSLNDARGLEAMRQKYALLGTSGRDNVEFVCMYGFNTSLAEDVQRFRFLRSLPGAYVFVQRYRPVPGGPAPDLSRLFDERADALLEELVRIVFPQNMKSMETYYRWLALQYAAQRGRVHRRLVETLFRFNGRPRMSGFLHRLEEAAKEAKRKGVNQ